MRGHTGDEVRKGRLAKAVQFQDAAHTVLNMAEDPREVADAVTTLAVHAGIAASDAICAALLGQYHQGQDHRGAVNLLKKADHDSARNLDLLLGVKTRAGYGYDSVSVAQLRRTMRSMDALVQFARHGTR